MGKWWAILLMGVAGVAQAAEWKFDADADIELEGLYSTQSQVGPDDRGFRGIGTFKFPSTLRSGRAFRLKLLPLAQVDQQNVSQNERFYWDFPEAYLQYQSLPWTFQAGLNVFQWGDTDVFNPLDVVNPRRYFDPLRSEKIGTPALVVKRDFKKFFVEAIYMPVQRRTLLPGEDSRWLPRDIFRTRSVGTGEYGTWRVLLPKNLRYRYQQHIEIDDPLKNNFGLRAKFRFSGFDWTVAAYEGSAPAPTVTVGLIRLTGGSLASKTISVDPDVQLLPIYYRNRMYGTSFVWVLGDFLVKGASAVNKPTQADIDLPKKAWENALGLERTFGLGEGSVTALVQGTYVRRDEDVVTNSISLARMFDRAVMGALRWAPDERWTVLLSYLNDLHFKGSLVHSEVAWRIADGWRTKVSGDFLSGPTETPLGTYKDNDRVTLSLGAQW
jgi:hypothetical protein